MLLRERHQFIVDSMINKVVGWLLRNLANDAKPLIRRHYLHDYPGWMRRATDVTYFAGTYKITKGAERFVLRGCHR